MQGFFRRLMIAVALVCLVALAGSAGAQSSDGLVRFVHAIPGAGALDIYVDDQLTIEGLESGTATAHLLLPAGDHTLRATQAGVTDALWEQTVPVNTGSAQTLVASSPSSLEWHIYPDDLAPLDMGKARFTAIHAVPNGPTVDVMLSDGRPVIASLAYGQAYGTLDLPVLSYELAVVPTGSSVDTAIVPVSNYGLDSGTYYVLLIYGPADNPQVLLLPAPVSPAADSGFVRFVHTIPGSGVDLYIDGILAAPGLQYGDSTVFVGLPAATYQVNLNPSGLSSPLVSGEVTVTAGQYTTAAATDATGSPALETFTVDTSPVAARQSVVNVVNFLSDGSTASLLADGTPVMGDVVSGANSTGLIEPTGSDLTVSLSGATTGDLPVPVGTIYGGVFYEVFVVPGAGGTGEVLVPQPASLAQTVNSAPGAGAAVAMEPTVPAPTDAAAPVATEDPLVAVTEGAAPTEAAPPPDATQPAPVTANPSARVLLDAGVNLQLRQYPNSDAFSLGLVPGGATLEVLGRQGGIVFLPLETPPPDATEFVDPATLLGENADLTPAQTWLFSVYQTPDGGEVRAWVNAFYLAVSSPTGLTMRLRDLPTIPANQPGEASDTSLGPVIATPTQVQAVVGGLDEGVNLQIRRQPNTTGESLTLVPNGTSLDLLGFSPDMAWVYVRLNQETGSVSGWANALYFVQYTYQGQPISVEEIIARELATEVAEDTRGQLAGEIAQPAAPTQDPLEDAIVGTVFLNEGANLQLRRLPNAQAESLGLIPSGAQLVVETRTEDGLWLRTEFDGQDGWVAAEYLTLTFNERPFALNDVPVFLGNPAQPNLPTPTLTTMPSVTPTEVLRQAVITADGVGMTREPGGSGEGMPILSSGRMVFFINYDPTGNFAIIMTEDFIEGWVPVSAVRILE